MRPGRQFAARQVFHGRRERRLPAYTCHDRVLAAQAHAGEPGSEPAAAGGAVALVKEQTLANSFHLYSHWVMAIATAVVALYVFSNWRIGRTAGVILLGAYCLYIIGLVNGVSLDDLIVSSAEGTG